MKPLVPLRRSLSDPDLLGHVMVGNTFRPHRILLMAAFGEELTEDERVIFQQFTGRDHEPNKCVSEFCVIAGRRTGKTSGLMSTAATYISGLCDFSDVLRSGETGTLLCLAQDQRVAKQLLDYVEDNFARSPILQQLVVNRTSDAIELNNNIRVEVRPASFRKLRGPTYVAIIADELAFWYSDDGGSVNPDVEIIAAARPGLMTTHGPLLTASSPYARRGLLWDTFKKHFGAHGDPLVLVAKGTTREFNPNIGQAEIDRELDRDPIKNRAEYLAEFRADIESFVSLESVQFCILPNVYERSPMLNTCYYGFVDPSGGSSDSMTLAIGHYDYSKNVVVLDAIREARPPFSPEFITIEFAKILNSYNVSTIIGDRFAGVWPVEQFGKVGIQYEQSAKPKSDLYTDLLPLINSRRIELLDHPKLIGQLTNLERTTAGVAATVIDHPPGSHDDLANAVAGLAQIN